jgi:predicted permease
MLSAIRTLGLERLPRAFEVRMDAPAAAYTLLLTALIGLLVGLTPIAALRQRNLAQAFREEGRSGTAARGARLVRRALVTAQVALALVLLTGSALLFTSFRQLLRVDPGFRAENVWSGFVPLPDARYRNDDSLRAFQRRMLEGVRAVPGVTAAGMTDMIPFGPGTSDSVIFAEGYQPKPGESIITAYQTNVTPGYFETMGVRLLRGRLFDGHDAATSPRVIIVDDRMARRFWPNQDPIGKRMWRPDDPRLFPPTDQSQYLTVVGVVNTVKLMDLTGALERFGAVYYPMEQNPSSLLVTVARGGVDAAALTAAVRSVVRRLDPELPLFNVRTMIERRDQMMQNRRTPVVLSVAFGAIALFLAVIGIYGVLAYLVVQRRREIGIRMALGGNTRSIFGLVLREGVLIVAAGAVLGVAGTLAIGRVLESQLYGVRPTDPLVIAATCSMVALVAVLACLVPARRAAQTDPVRALNEL